MGICECLVKILCKCIGNFCSFVNIFSICSHRPKLKKFLYFVGGFVLGHVYYYYTLKKIPFQHYIGTSLALFISIMLGFGNVVCRQMRCISLLLFPMYCGKAGRGVLKAFALTFVVAARVMTHWYRPGVIELAKLALQATNQSRLLQTIRNNFQMYPKLIIYGVCNTYVNTFGPITNMGLNAKEVVRVFACTTQLSYNLSREKHELVARPLRTAALGLRADIEQVKDTFRSFRDIITPIEIEVEDTGEQQWDQLDNDRVDDMFELPRRSEAIEYKYRAHAQDSIQQVHNKTYLRKLEYRCERQLSRAVDLCMHAFGPTYDLCNEAVIKPASVYMCWPLKLPHVCSIMRLMRDNDTCDSTTLYDPGFIEGYVQLKRLKTELTNKLKDIRVQYKVVTEQELHDIQDPKDTGERVIHAFEEKMIIIHMCITVLNICMALLSLRILSAAITYHDYYLTSIDYDNVYITDYFKRLDKRRKKRKQCSLLPLKKMERSKYVDVYSAAYMTSQRNKLVTQILKVMLEMVTATTFVMLDRLFYEALDVVRQHALSEASQQSTRDLEIEVEGTGMVSSLVRKVVDGFNSHPLVRRHVTNQPCVPRPSLMSPVFFVKIYGGYLWIIVLLCVNPYTLRLRRLICSMFYPRREKQRILRLYNDILKKRLRMQKTLRRKAVQAVRAHYLTGENLLSMRIKFPRLLGWLTMLPAARMTCLICGETEPRTDQYINPSESWHSCTVPKCPFVYCTECWQDVGERCLACDPSLADLSDIDSLSEDEPPRI